MCYKTNLSIISHTAEFNNSLSELVCSDDDSGNEGVLDMEYSEAEAENLKKNAEVLCFEIYIQASLSVSSFKPC